MPWITATAFLHSVMMQEKKGMMKVWNMVLVSATFLLSILGTTLTRTGLVSSVHAFAQSPVKPYFTTFLLTAVALTAFAIIKNLPYLKSEVKLESVVSRESSFLFNNLILLASCFAVLWGTLFPVLMEALTGEKESIDAPYYNRVNIPIALFLLFLTGVGPLIAWRNSSLNSLMRAFLIRSIVVLAPISTSSPITTRPSCGTLTGPCGSGAKPNPAWPIRTPGCSPTRAPIRQWRSVTLAPTRQSSPSSLPAPITVFGPIRHRAPSRAPA